MKAIVTDLLPPSLKFTVVLFAFCALGWGGGATGHAATAQSKRDLILRYFDRWANHGDIKAADELIATDVVLRHPHVTVNGLATYKQSMAAFHAAFPDLRFVVEDTVAEGDKVLARWRMMGTQRGDFQNHPASDRSMAISGMSLFRLRAGKIQEIWVNMDRLGMMDQLGWLPAPPSPAAGYFELRLYDVTRNKMAGVLERFRETVEPLRRRHGIQTVGYWTTSATNEEKFIYLMSAASAEDLEQRERKFGADPDFQKGYAASNVKHGKTVDKIISLPLTAGAAKFDFVAAKSPRAFELRIYSVLPGKLAAFQQRWSARVAPLYQRHGLHSVGWWVADTKDDAGHDQFICLLAGESVDAIQASIAAFHQDPEWQETQKLTERDGPLRDKVQAFKLIPTGFSALK